MRPEDLIKPISSDAPCGEDLLAADDPDFMDYYFNVEDRLPTSYFNLARGTLFDSKSVDAKGEAAQIEPLLKRSRDLRLLGIEAKFQILSGRFKGFVDAVTGMAALLDTYPDAVHPIDPQDRRNAVEELNAVATVVAPLEYVALFNDKRAGDITYRPYGISTGKISARSGEEAGDASNITGALGSAENAKVVEALHQQLTDLLAALATMTRVCQAGSGGVSPKFDRVAAKLSDMMEMVMTSRPDLAAAAAPAEAEGGGEATTTGPAAAGGGTTTITLQATSADVPDHKAAYRLLQALEKYFVTTEPGSLALLLVVQARLLVGRPLVEALDVLMEAGSGKAMIKFGVDSGFSISMSRMRELSSQANIPPVDSWSAEGASQAGGVIENVDPAMVEGEEAGAGEGTPPAPAAEVPSQDVKPFDIVNRDHAGMVLKQVEEFYQIREPASPIPVLLFKARNMLSKDFHALARELIPN